MQQSPFFKEANSHLASSEISRSLWNQIVHYHIHVNQQLDPIYSKPPTYHITIHFNIICPSTHRSPSNLFPNLCMHFYFSHACYLIRPYYYLPWYGHSKTVNSQLSSIQASSMSIKLDKISMKNYNFYKVVEKQICYTHVFTCHMVFSLPATN
jgi:hypothetical protein